MAGDLVRFVDSIASAPTVRLDVNDEAKWYVRTFEAPPPRLRRAQSQNAMRDGIYVSSSQYDARVLRIELDLVANDQDTNATELQKLFRELDRVENYLMYQPTGASKPVFFKLYRSDAAAVVDQVAAKAFRRPVIELLAEPFALGLRETLGSYTVNNDPAAGSNGCFFDVTGVIGDVPAPCVISDEAPNRAYGVLAVRQHGTPSSLTAFFQAESASLGTDTTNPGGGPDAAMSGAGVNNFLRTSFATVATMATRVTISPTLSTHGRGTYRVFACVRRSAAVVDMNARFSYGGIVGDTVAIPKTTSRTLLDLGLVTIQGQTPVAPGYGSVPLQAGTSVDLQAQRVSGAETLDWDFIALIPADERVMQWFTTAGDGSVDFVFDGVNEVAHAVNDATLLYSGGGAANLVPTFSLSISGGFPMLMPNQTNRFYLLCSSSTATPGVNAVKTTSQVISINYWPRYLYVRPAAS